MTRSPSRWSDATLFALVGIAIACAIRPMWDIDLFWHVVAGDVIRELGALPTTDTFSSIRPERPWIPFQWAYEVLMSFVDDLGGLELLRWLHIGLHAIAFALAAWLARTRVGALAAVVVGLLIVAYLDRIRARPHVFNLLGILGTLWWMVIAERAGMARRGALVASLTLLGGVWANLHAGGSVVLLMLIGAWGLGLAIARRPSAPAIWIAGSVCGLAMACSPGFVPGVVQAVAMYGETKSLIPEWQASSVYLLDPKHPIHPVMGLVPWIALALSAIALWRERRACIPEALGALVLIGLALHTARFLYLAALVPIVWPTTLDALARPPLRRRAALAFAALLGLLFAHEHFFVQRASPSEAWARAGLTLEPGRFPEEAASMLEAADLRGGVLNQSDWGGYLLYRGWPHRSMCSDGRGNFGADMVEHMRASHRMIGRAAYLSESQRRFPTDLIVMPPSIFELDVHDAGRFLLVHADPKAEVYLVEGPRFAQNVAKVMHWYARRGWKLPDPRAEPRRFELAVRVGRARDMRSRARWRAAYDSLRTRATGESPAARAAVLELAAWLDDEGDLPAAERWLNGLADSTEPARGLGAAARVRLAALRIRLGVPPDALRPVLDGVDPAALAPVDRRLLARVSLFLRGLP